MLSLLFEQVWHLWIYFFGSFQLTSPLGHLHEFFPQAVHGIEVSQWIITCLIRDQWAAASLTAGAVWMKSLYFGFPDKGQHSKYFSYCGRFSGMWKFLQQDFVTIQLVDSREEWRSKWKKNPLEVKNYPSLEVALMKQRYSLVGMGCSLYLLCCS